MVLLRAKRIDALFRGRHAVLKRPSRSVVSCGATYGGVMTDAACATDASDKTPGPRPRRRRLVAAGVLLLTIAAGLTVHAGAPDGAASDIAGDALYAVAAYLAVVNAAPRLRTFLVAAVAAAWCTLIELFQLTGVPLALGSAFSPIMLVLGTVFDPRDLVVYLATVVVAAVIDGFVRRGPAGRTWRA